jgi:hypothetical protein
MSFSAAGKAPCHPAMGGTALKSLMLRSHEDTKARRILSRLGHAETGCATALCQGTTLQLAEKVGIGMKWVAQRLKPNSLQSIYVRPEGRTLQKLEIFRKLFSRAVSG